MTVISSDNLRKRLARFVVLLERDLRREFRTLRQQYADHRFYVVGLYTTPLFAYFAPIGNSEEAVRRKTARWSPGHWTCRLDSLDGMDPSNRALSHLLRAVPDDRELDFLKHELKNAVFGVLERLRNSGTFDPFGPRGKVIINVVTPDDVGESWISDAARLNPPRLWRRMARELRAAGLCRSRRP